MVFVLFANAQQKIEILNNDSVIINPLNRLNSSYRETNISISPDGKYLYFMSNRGGNNWNIQASNYYKQAGFDGDIWYSKKIESIWGEPKALSAHINTSEGEDEPVISPDGQVVYFQSWADGWQIIEGPYYKAKLIGSNWDSITGLGGGITEFFKIAFAKNKQAATDGMAISPNEDFFIVAYNKQMNLPMDLYFSKKINGKWSELKNMKLNTNLDERSIFIAADGKTIYFASNGYGGFGGLDIFKTTIDDDGNHGEIINIGKPFNTEKDDYCFIITASGSQAYFVRNGDIYQADISSASQKLKPKATKIISGKFLNKDLNPVSASVFIVNAQTKEQISTSRTNLLTGEFSLVSSSTLGRFELIISLENKQPITIPIEFANEDLFESFEITGIIDEEKNNLLELSSLLTVYFDYDNYILKEEYKKTINNWLNINKSNIKSIDLCGYTDNDGSVEYNLKLGKKRAENVANYLQEIKIETKNIKSQGKLNPIATNNSAEGKAYNRRVELKILWDFQNK